MASDTDPEVDSETQGASTSPQMTWVDAMEEVFGSAVDRQAEIEMELDDMDVKVPVQLGEDPSYADWKLNGTVKLRFDGISGPLADWLRYYARGEQPPVPGDQDGTDASADDTDQSD